jgi:hypothetical protein
LKRYSIQSTAHALLLVLAYLLAACGVGTTGSAPPTLGPITSDTPIVAPTPPNTPPPPVQPTAAASAPTQPAQSTAAASAPSPTIQPAATSQVAADTVLISYHKSGGIAGVDETLTVYVDGTVELLTRDVASTMQADPIAIQALQKLLDSPEFAALQVPALPLGADYFIYELTLPGRKKPIIVADGVGTPPVLREVIGALEQLKTQAK